MTSVLSPFAAGSDGSIAGCFSVTGDTYFGLLVEVFGEQLFAELSSHFKGGGESRCGKQNRCVPLLHQPGSKVRQFQPVGRRGLRELTFFLGRPAG